MRKSNRKDSAGLINLTAVSKTILAALFVAIGTFCATLNMQAQPPTITFMPNGSGEITLDIVDEALENHFQKGVQSGTQVWENPNRAESFTAVFGAGTTAIGFAAFNSCYYMLLTSLPAGITTIGDIAFGVCTGLTSITLPTSLTSIGESAFHSCYNLQSVTILRSTPPTLGTEVFVLIKSDCKLYVPNLAALDNYKNDADWYAVFGDSIFVISSEPSSDEEPGIDEVEFLYGEGGDGQVVDENTPMKNKFKVSFGHIRDADKNTKFRVIYEIKNAKGRTIYKNETITSKAELEETNYDLEKIYNLRASGNGQGTIILTIKDMKGKVLSTQSKTFTVVDIPPRIINMKKKK